MSDDDIPKGLHRTDEALLKAAVAGVGGIVAVTPELLKSMKEGIEARTEYAEREFPRLVAECPEETRLAVTEWVFRHLIAHAKDDASFRYLIYTRLGFGPEAYVPLYNAGGMTISNEFDLRGNNDDGNSPA